MGVLYYCDELASLDFLSDEVSALVAWPGVGAVPEVHQC